MTKKNVMPSATPPSKPIPGKPRSHFEVRAEPRNVAETDHIEVDGSNDRLTGGDSEAGLPTRGA